MCFIKTIYISITCCLTTCFPLWFYFFFFNSLYASASFFYRYPEDLIIKSTKSISVCRGSYYGRPGKVSVPFKARNVIHGLVSLPVWIIRFILFIIVFSFAVIIKKDYSFSRCQKNLSHHLLLRLDDTFTVILLLFSNMQ